MISVRYGICIVVTQILNRKDFLNKGSDGVGEWNFLKVVLILKG